MSDRLKDEEMNVLYRANIANSHSNVLLTQNNLTGQQYRHSCGSGPVSGRAPFRCDGLHVRQNIFRLNGRRSVASSLGPVVLDHRVCFPVV